MPGKEINYDQKVSAKGGEKMRTFRAILMPLILLLATGFVYTANSSADAKKLYGEKCAMCHGQNGEGNDVLAGSLADGDKSKLNLTDPATSQKTDKELKNIILNGSGKMPPFKSSLSGKDLDELVKYIRALKKK